MTAKELRQKYLDFFQSKGHTVIPSASLIPENDPTTLFTGSGMQPLVPYLLGEKHPQSIRLTDLQKCFRTQDIEEVGDNRHTTFFEMLGNWSLGDYFKKEQIGWIFEFLTEEIGLDPNRLYVSVFRGDEKLGVPRDIESVNYWKEQFAKVNIQAKDVDFAEQGGMQDGRIFYYDAKKNWWSRVMDPEKMPVGEPGGPNSEMFWDFGPGLKIHENSKYKNEPCHVNCDCGRFLEIGNNVFMQYIKTENGFDLLPKKNIDFGGGLERLIATKNSTSDIFLTDLFGPIITKLEELSGKKYDESEKTKKSFRIIADHLKASTFLISDGAAPSNAERGYFLRRLIRRAVRYGKMVGIENNFTAQIAETVLEIYRGFYRSLEENKENIFSELEKEENKFRKTLNDGVKALKKIFNMAIGGIDPENLPQGMVLSNNKIRVDGKMVFHIYETYGLPIEISQEIMTGWGISFDEKTIQEAKEAFEKHQELSRTASVGMFKGGLADSGEKTIKLHTAAHLMLAGLRKVLGEHVTQKGSNITAERLRFDFAHGEKMTPEQIAEVEKIVNQQIQKKMPVVCEEMTLDEAKKQGAMGVFESKYGEKVKVYTIGPSTSSGQAISKEICGGPHVQNTGELGVFKIKKEESSSAGVRRIKAILE